MRFISLMSVNTLQKFILTYHKTDNGAISLVSRKPTVSYKKYVDYTVIYGVINGIIHVAITIVVFPTCLSWDEPSIVIFMFLWRGYLEDKIIVETRDSTKNFKD